jgi:hypothetical protein
MKTLWVTLFAIGVFGLSGFAVKPAHAQRGGNYYTDANGVVWSADRNYYWDREARYWHKVRDHRRRRNVLLGVGAVGAVTGSGTLMGVGFGGAAANEIIDRRHRDW